MHLLPISNTGEHQRAFPTLHLTSSVGTHIESVHSGGSFIVKTNKPDYRLTLLYYLMLAFKAVRVNALRRGFFRRLFPFHKKQKISRNSEMPKRQEFGKMVKKRTKTQKRKVQGAGSGVWRNEKEWSKCIWWHIYGKEVIVTCIFC